MRKTRITALFGLFLALLSCQDKEQAEVPVTNVSVTPSSLEINIGDSKALTATVTPSNATNPKVSWTSSNPSVATVSADGNVSGMAEGSAVITAKAENKTGTCTVNVSKPFIGVQSVTLNKSTLPLVEGESETLIATVKPDYATDKTVTWSTSSEAVATVDQNGKVTAVKAGTATITAKAGEKTAACEVTVSAKYIAVETVTLNKNTLPLVEGESETLIATVKPDNATDKTVTWSTSNEAVATVDQNGKVTATGGGEAIITAKAEEITAACKVTVTVPVQSVQLDHTEITLSRGQTLQFTATVNPEDASDKSVTWSSDNPAVATVDQSGKVTAIEKGSTTITANASGKTASCAVTVLVPAESVSLDATSVTLVEGQSYTLTATILPSDTTDKIIWTSSDATVVKVENGKVTALKQGTAVVTVEAGEKTASCTFTVNAAEGGNEGIGYEEW